MYDLSELSKEEGRMLSIFAVLPAENIPFDILEDLLSEDNLDEILLSLFQKGWLDFNEEENSFKVSPVIQEITKEKNNDVLEDCEKLIDNLIEKLDYEEAIGHLKNVSYEAAILLIRYSENIYDSFEIPNYDLGILLSLIHI